MKTSVKNIALFLVAIIVFASCSDDIVPPMAENVTERVDMLLSEEEDFYVYEQSMESESIVDLVKYDLSGMSNSNFAYAIQISEYVVLKVNIYDSETNQPYNRVGVSYSQYAHQDLNDKSRYVTMELIDTEDGSEAEVYTSSIITNDSPIINAFSISKYDYWEKETLCRINGMKMYHQYDYDEVITITGTFRGAITFN